MPHVKVEVLLGPNRRLHSLSLFTLLRPQQLLGSGPYRLFANRERHRESDLRF